LNDEVDLPTITLEHLAYITYPIQGSIEEGMKKEKSKTFIYPPSDPKYTH
jgi:hypothetical protein